MFSSEHPFPSSQAKLFLLSTSYSFLSFFFLGQSNLDESLILHVVWVLAVLGWADDDVGFWFGISFFGGKGGGRGVRKRKIGLMGVYYCYCVCVLGVGIRLLFWGDVWGEVWDEAIVGVLLISTMFCMLGKGLAKRSCGGFWVMG